MADLVSMRKVTHTISGSVIEDGAPATKKAWNSSFQLPDMSLEFISPTVEPNKILKAPDDIYDDGSKEWQHCVVVQFLGKIPNLGQIQRTLNMIWGRDGQVRITSVDSNLFVIQLPSEDTRTWVLQSGPWHIMNRPIVVRKWELGLKLLDQDLSTFPVWVNLKGVPLDLYTRKGLSFIASGLGKPLHMDRATAMKQKIEVAKVCIEINFETEMPEYLEIELRNGVIARIGIEVPWKPKKCAKCKLFGHTDCSKFVGKQFIPKKMMEPSVDTQKEMVVNLEVEGSPFLAPISSSEEKLTMVDFPPLSRKEAYVVSEPPKGSDNRFEVLADPCEVVSSAASPSALNVADSPSLSAVKKAKGKQDVVIPKGSHGSVERFEILTQVPVDKVFVSYANDSVVSTSHGVSLSSARNTRVASAGVAELMKQLKPKKRNPATKGGAKG